MAAPYQLILHSVLNTKEDVTDMMLPITVTKFDDTCRIN